MNCRPGRLVVPVVLALLSAVSSSAETPAVSRVFLDHDLKATFLVRLAAYVSWPSARPADPRALTICLVGKNKLNGSLEHYRGRNMEERVVRVRELRIKDSMAVCDIVYLSRDESRGRDVLKQLAKLSGVLTVSDRDDFSCGGGMIRFVAIDDRLALEVNRSAATEAGLQISSDLLAIAKRPDLAGCGSRNTGATQ